MFFIGQNPHNDFILRTSRNIEKQRRKLSAGYKKRNKNDRQKQKIQSSSKIVNNKSQQMRKNKYRLNPHHESSIKKPSLIHILDDKNMLLIPNHKVSTQTHKKNPQITMIIQNINDVLKSNQKTTKQTNQYKNKFSLKDDFLCLRSRLNQHFYQGIKSKEYDHSLMEMKKQLRYETSSKRYVLSPFVSNNIIIFNSAILNEPPNVRKTEFEVTNSQQIQKSFNRRKTQIGNIQRKTMTFDIRSSEADHNYLKKIKNYLQFLFKVNFSNNIYVNLDIKNQENTSITKYRVFIGKGNNSLLVKSILKRRFWWEITHNIDQGQINFYWSQSKIDKILSNQDHANSKKQITNSIPKKTEKIFDEAFSLNKKILSQQKSLIVDKYIQNEGFIIPFQEFYTANLITNHLPRNNAIGSKKHLFKSLFYYYTKIADKNPFDFIPKTYHIHSKDGQQYNKFIQQNSSQPSKIWIVKPGQNTNRGKQIKLSSFSKIEQCLTKQKHHNGEAFTYIIQSYLNKPFLFNNRKFDIRHYILLTSINGILKCYWYRQGYIRTSSQIFDLENLGNKFIHLTNDAIQKYGENYQKYEQANKISYHQFQRYLDYYYPKKGYDFQKDILVKMKEMAADIIKANYLVIDHRRLKNNFQIFGLDFMIDRQWKPWLIEANYNPCLEVNCPVLQRVIPGMLQNTFRLALDPLFPPPYHFPCNKRFYLSDNYLKNLKYELIFDEDSLDGNIKSGYIFEDEQQQDEEYQDQGQQLIDIHV